MSTLDGNFWKINKNILNVLEPKELNCQEIHEVARDGGKVAWLPGAQQLPIEIITKSVKIVY